MPEGFVATELEEAKLEALPKVSDDPGRKHTKHYDSGRARGPPASGKGGHVKEHASQQPRQRESNFHRQPKEISLGGGGKMPVPTTKAAKKAAAKRAAS